MRIPAAKHWQASPAPEGPPRFAHERQGGSGKADAASASPPDEAAAHGPDRRFGARGDGQLAIDRLHMVARRVHADAHLAADVLDAHAGPQQRRSSDLLLRQLHAARRPDVAKMRDQPPRDGEGERRLAALGVLEVALDHLEPVIGPREIGLWPQ